ncbi:SMC-Scp complex subunit ScpB [Cyanobacterium aponinum AL20118]|uniref:Condensin subunit ScpB n=3 Tax=Cyanobacterium aponinum TaxID=379064 RepID=K9Z852_CYAAP|nr:SMC-Scp complex subunit ScpB [Cyanobacterium aponinum]AFZ54563.1 condensin subunit ScpB [Cyanobacterium aponinum PCC 10605]MBD2395707.1 SMC-Scp complex subunit ScpB [Cyanobacterium aponinum FACHB-4101]MTF39624.1 SMC-Scp complex subunit ScpB [Cyanobacterium aponinum 0216]WPF88036.1 SMC-Scp complex subunit ScpB [Cyanobacterium aponinum AL20115]
MDQKIFSPSLSQHIEAILYLKAQPTTLQEIVTLTNHSTEEVQEALIQLMSDYAYRNSALEIIETEQGYSLQLQSEYLSLLSNLVPAELNTATLKTLAAIALQSPILQSDLINLRGSTAYQHVSELVESGFIRKRRQEEGRSYWLEVTDKFHKYFEFNQAQTEEE